MSATFAIIATLIVAGAIGAMSLRNLVHCALCLVVALAGLAVLFLQLDAQFAGLVQVLVYVGAVAILIVFAILLTRGIEPAHEPITWSKFMGIGIAVLAGGDLIASTLASTLIHSSGVKPDVSGDVTVGRIGAALMTEYVLPLEVMALLLTAAMIGAVLIAMEEKERP